MRNEIKKKVDDLICNCPQQELYQVVMYIEEQVCDLAFTEELIKQLKKAWSVEIDDGR